MNPDLLFFASDLREQQRLCREMLELMEREAEMLRAPEKPDLTQVSQAKKILLPLLSQSLHKLRGHRTAWESLPNAQRAARCPDAAALMQDNQELIMKILVLDRENEQSLLRRGMLPPASIPVPPQRSYASFARHLPAMRPP